MSVSDKLTTAWLHCEDSCFVHPDILIVPFMQSCQKYKSLLGYKATESILY